MSKRFGRNQKRALTAEIARLEQAATMANGLVAHQRSTIDRQDESLRRVAGLLGPYFIGLPAKTARASAIPRKWQIPSIDTLATAATVGEQIQTLRVHSLELIEARSFVDKLSDRVHIKVETPLGAVAYGFTESCFDGMPPSEAAHYLGQKMAQCLLSQRALEGRE